MLYHKILLGHVAAAVAPLVVLDFLLGPPDLLRGHLASDVQHLVLAAEDEQDVEAGPHHEARRKSMAASRTPSPVLPKTLKDELNV